MPVATIPFEYINGAQTHERRIGHPMALILLRDVVASGCTPGFNHGIDLRIAIHHALLEHLQLLLRWKARPSTPIWLEAAVSIAATLNLKEKQNKKTVRRGTRS